jgi:meso-butanediol dehydrogenase/(S,S)-butanediol dehydrogenase/diacetyl reductase
MGRLDGKVAIITGGASGIGAATIRRFAAEGAAVVCADINDDAGTQLVTGVQATGGVAAFHHTDVSSLAELQAAVAFAVERFGGLDIIHNNAVWSGGGFVADIDPSSIEAFVAEMMAAPYNTAKAGMINLSRTVAVEYGRKNIRSNCICPGVVETPLFEMLVQMTPKSRAEIAAEHALGRLIKPEEIANVALFLASDESSAITGSAIIVDGGLISNSPISGFPPFGA